MSNIPLERLRQALFYPALSGTIDGLRPVIDLARQHGAMGADLAIPAAAARTEPRS